MAFVTKKENSTKVILMCCRAEPNFNNTICISAYRSEFAAFTCGYMMIVGRISSDAICSKRLDFTRTVQLTYMCMEVNLLRLRADI